MSPRCSRTSPSNCGRSCHTEKVVVFVLRILLLLYPLSPVLLQLRTWKAHGMEPLWTPRWRCIRCPIFLRPFRCHPSAHPHPRSHPHLRPQWLPQAHPSRLWRLSPSVRLRTHRLRTHTTRISVAAEADRKAATGSGKDSRIRIRIGHIHRILRPQWPRTSLCCHPRPQKRTWCPRRGAYPVESGRSGFCNHRVFPR